jgi:hypothetical protein
MEQTCPTCGYQNPGDSNFFCMSCGNKLEITSISNKIPQFRFPSMRSLVAGDTSNTGYNSPVGTDSIDKTEYNSPIGTDSIDKTEYNSPVGGGIGNVEYDSLASSGSAGNIEYDLPIGWVTSNAEYNLPVGGVVGSIVYDTPVISSSTSDVEQQLPFVSGGAGNIGYDLPISSDDTSNNTYSSPVNSGFSPVNNLQQQVRLVQSAGASVLGPAQLSSMLSSIPGRLPRHAFAGRGSRMTHHSWLLDGEYLNAAKLHSTVADLLSQRNFQTLKLNIEKLQEHGHWAEKRDYIVMQQGITTVFLYVAPAWQDLYISRTTTVQPPFNLFRIFLLIFALGEFLFGPSVLSHLISSLTMHRSAETGIALIASFTISILLIPSILFLVTFLLASFRHWFTQKDFWVYLRRNTLNDFEVDDVLLLEHATDDAVRTAVDQLNMDATRITPPVAGYQPRRRIRII